MHAKSVVGKAHLRVGNKSDWFFLCCFFDENYSITRLLDYGISLQKEKKGQTLDVYMRHALPTAPSQDPKWGFSPTVDYVQRTTATRKP